MRKYILTIALILSDLIANAQTSAFDDPEFKYHLLAYALIVIATIFITRAIYSIPTIVKNLKAQTEILKLLAEKNEVDEEKLKVIDEKLTE